MTRAEVLFTAEGSVRYHRSRASYFSSINKWLTIFTVFLGSGVVVMAFASVPALTMATGFVVALINVYRLVAKPDQSSRDHEKLCREWAELVASVQAKTNPSERQISGWINRVQILNSSCLEDMKAVKAHAYNETMGALGLKGEPYTLGRFQRATKHVFSHTHAFDDQNFRLNQP